MLSHCGFDLHLSGDWWGWAIFHVPVGHLHIVIGNKCLFRSSSHFLIVFCFVLILSYMNCLYISHIKPLLITVVVVWLFVTPWTAAYQDSLSFTISRNLVKLTPTESVMPSNHLILCHPILLLPIFPSIRVFSSELALYKSIGTLGQSIGASASALVRLMNIQGWFSLELTGLIFLLSKGFSRVFSNTTVQKHQFFSAQCSVRSNSHIHIWLLEKP